ncbi:MAG: polyphosphate polymerase domain-containing protein [Armatimonadetes bacterium]|nr:polyphosphate polymerase domain-containing protein [Armatimonadota bacterium]
MTVTRYEIKFLLPLETADRVCAAAKPNLVADQNGDDAQYRVTSVYFDSLDLAAYWEKLDGEALRRKLRLRFYGQIETDELDDRPYFLELKYRKNDSVFKDRIELSRDVARAVLEDPTTLEDLGRLTAGSGVSKSFVEVVQRYASSASLRASDTVSYKREAWLGEVDRRLRLTIDGTVHAYAPETVCQVGSDSGLPLLPPGMCVLEVKFNTFIPRWMREILVAEQLSPRRFSKYAQGLETLRRVPSRVRSNKWGAVIRADPGF